METTYYLKYDCVHHEVYFSNILDELTPRPPTPTDKGFFPKIKPIENWGINKITILNDQKKKIKDFVVPKESGFDLQNIKYIRIDITIEAISILKVNNFDIESIEIYESINGLVNIITDCNNNIITLMSDHFEGDLKDKFGFKSVYYELVDSKFKVIKISN
jgi:hypothetical protein